jgi:hypothetical protein
VSSAVLDRGKSSLLLTLCAGLSLRWRRTQTGEHYEPPLIDGVTRFELVSERVLNLASFPELASLELSQR